MENVLTGTVTRRGRKFVPASKQTTITEDAKNKLRFFCHWVRQYVGLIDVSGKKNIIVQFINNAKPRRVNRLLGKGSDMIQRRLVNKSTKEVVAYGSFFPNPLFDASTRPLPKKLITD